MKDIDPELFEKWKKENCSRTDLIVMKVWNHYNSEIHPKFKRKFLKFIKEKQKPKGQK